MSRVWKGNKNCTYLDGPDPSGYANIYRYSFTSGAVECSTGRVHYTATSKA